MSIGYLIFKAHVKDSNFMSWHGTLQFTLKMVVDLLFENSLLLKPWVLDFRQRETKVGRLT